MNIRTDSAHTSVLQPLITNMAAITFYYFFAYPYIAYTLCMFAQSPFFHYLVLKIFFLRLHIYHEMIVPWLFNHYPHHFLADIVFFSFFRNNLTVLDVLEGRTHTILLPINLRTVFLVAEDKWLLVESKTNQWVDLHRTSCHVL